jgi:hypothetical protein
MTRFYSSLTSFVVDLLVRHQRIAERLLSYQPNVTRRCTGQLVCCVTDRHWTTARTNSSDSIKELGDSTLQTLVGQERLKSNNQNNGRQNGIQNRLPRILF